MTRHVFRRVVHVHLLFRHTPMHMITHRCTLMSIHTSMHMSINLSIRTRDLLCLQVRGVHRHAVHLGERCLRVLMARSVDGAQQE